MSNVRRVYVEKKEAYAVKAKELQEEIKSYLGITSVTGVRVLIRYDVENISEATYQRALVSVFSEPPVDDIASVLNPFLKYFWFAIKIGTKSRIWVNA